MKYKIKHRKLNIFNEHFYNASRIKRLLNKKYHLHITIKSTYKKGK